MMSKITPNWRRKLPVILQMNQMECGVACLTMILNYHGHSIKLNDVRQHFQPGRGGVSALEIVQVARQFGLRAKTYSIDLEQFQYIPLPAVVHWKFDHYVVVEKWSDKQVQIVDPGMGRQRLDIDVFGQYFTGIVMALQPGMHFQQRRPSGSQPWMHYLWRTVRQKRSVLFQILAASLLIQLFGLALPLLTQIVVDYILPIGLDDLMGVLGIGIVLWVLSLTVTTYLRATLLIYLEAHLDSDMMLGFFEHLLALPFTYFQKHSAGDLMMRLTSNKTIREILSSQSISVILDGSFIVVYLIIMMTSAFWFGTAVLVIGLLQIALLLASTKFIHQATQQRLATQAESESYLVEILQGMAALKASGAEAHVFERWSNLFAKNLNASLKHNHIAVVVDTGMTAIRLLAPLFLLWLGVYEVLNGRMTIGTMLALTALATATLTPLSSLVSNMRRFQLVGAHLERIVDVLQTEPEQKTAHTYRKHSLQGHIELKNVSFRYSNNDPMVLSDINLTIDSGQTVALVGYTGSGKSTLLKLILGLYKPTSGQILYDGIPYEDLDLPALRRQIGVVLQETFLFSGSIRENIALNRPDSSLDTVTAAAQLAHIHPEITDMPLAYETKLSDGGDGLSGGQRQRLAIARAVISRPNLLILDEATSHLDVVTEQKVKQNLSGLNGTQIIAAHRLSTIKNADEIVVLHQGHIVEHGSHQNLWLRQGHYYALLQSQMDDAPVLPSGFLASSHCGEERR